MATRYSTGAVNALGGKGKDHSFIGTNISFTASTKTIASAGNAFSAESKPGDKVRILGSQLNDGLYTIATVVGAGSITTVEALQDEAATAKIAVVCMSAAGSFKEVFANAVGAFYTGAQPANAEAVESGTLLGYLTVGGGEFTPGVAANGLNWDDAVAGVLAKKTGDVFQCTPVVSGTAGYLRLYDNARVTGASDTAIRVDLACGVGTGEVRLSSTTFTVGVPVTINSFTGTVSKNPA